MRIKKYLKVVKPSLKGSILVLFGIFNSRLGIGIEIFTINLIYGPIAYLFIALSGLMVIKLLQILDNPSHDSKLSKKRAIMLSGVLYLIGFILTIGNVIDNMAIYYLNIPILIFTCLIGIFWCLFGFFGFKYKKNITFVNILIETLVFTIGLIYGAFLNNYLIPYFIYFFFLSISFLQLSRELLKGFNGEDKIENLMEGEIRYNQQKILKYSFLSELLAIIFLIFLTVVNISNSIWFLLLMIFGIILISLAGILTFESFLEKKFTYKIYSIIKIGIFIELIALLLVGS